jgi:hypothetical protein
MNQPRGGDPQDFLPTQELGPAAARPGQGGGLPGPGEHRHAGLGGARRSRASRDGRPEAGREGGRGGGRGPAGGSGGVVPPGQARPAGGSGGVVPPGQARRSRRGLWWGAGLALVALLAGGGAVAVAALTSSTSATPSAPTGQAAVLNTMLSSASSPASAATTDSIAAGTTAAAAHPCLSRAAKLRAAGHRSAARDALRRCHALRRIRALGGIHGQFTFETKNGPRTVAYQRGVIGSVTSTGVVVQAKDNTTWTWDLKSDTVVRENGSSASTSALSDGERVFVAGPVASGTYDARVIVIRPSSGSSASGSSASGS